MKILTFLLSICFLISCSQQSRNSTDKQENTQNDLAVKTEKTVQEKPLERLPKSSEKKIELPDVKDFATVDVFRKSNYEAEIGIWLDNEPKIGDKVTVIPLQVKLEPFQLAIVKTEKKEEPCTGEKKEFYWNTELEKVTDKEILDISPIKDRADEFPFDVAIIYPSVEFVSNIESSKLSKAMIPNGVSINTVKAAIDLDNDGKPDLIEAVYCCSNPTETFNAENDCYTCQKTFKKINNNWKQINFEQPC